MHGLCFTPRAHSHLRTSLGTGFLIYKETVIIYLVVLKIRVDGKHIINTIYYNFIITIFIIYTWQFPLRLSHFIFKLY